ncbi:MAG TPA: hypothetical protein VM536_13835, partial [Chloroflexia bacterium]|nr:hypothetical protein [Chloroflexia bacterium]
MEPHPPIDRELATLLQETVTRFVDPAARVAGVRELPIDVGASGAAVHRYEVAFAGSSGPRSVRVVSKEANLVERRTLAYLNTQDQLRVPFSYTHDLDTDAPRLVYLQDLGSTFRPNSREPIAPGVAQAEAVGLAAIHAAGWGHGPTLPWLPLADRNYYHQMIERDFWRP